MGQTGSVLLGTTCSVVSLLTLQKRAVNAPSEPYGVMCMAGATGPQKALCQLAEPCWRNEPRLVILACLQPSFVSCFLLLHVQQGGNTAIVSSLFAISLGMLRNRAEALFPL